MPTKQPSTLSPEVDLENDRRARIRSVVFEFLTKKDSGEFTSPDDYQSLHPDLMPELAEALLDGTRKLRLVMDAERLSAQQRTMHDGIGLESSDFAVSPTHQPKIANYTLVEEISGGGQGTVFRAIHELTGRTVAIKVMTSVSKNSLARFDREARAMATLDHPGLVKILDRGRTADGTYFIAMDFVAGHDLDEWAGLQEKNISGQRTVIEVFRKIAAAIHVAHLQGIVHRDLKPSNIRVDSFGEPHIIDFGLASLSDAADRTLTTTGNIVGSVPWSSPEQAAGRSADVGSASDLYSLGVLLFQSLTGRFPYSVDGPLHTVTRSICSVRPIDPGAIKDGPFGRIDPSISEIILKCLAKKPEDRPATGIALAEMLELYLRGKYLKSSKRFGIRLKLVVVMLLVLGVWSTAAWFKTTPETLTLVLDLPHFLNSVRMDMVEIPAGTFTMGSPNREAGHSEDEQAHQVRITQSFHISRTEVTCGQYRRVMGSLPEDLVSATADNLPVEFVSRDDAIAFCRKLSDLEGRTYRLPTEAEWEYACRSGTTTGIAGAGQANAIAWLSENSGERTRPVGTLPPNQWGLHDLHGNVAEWTADGYISFLGNAAVDDPLRGTSNDLGVIRGGGAISPLDQCRSASRVALDPHIRQGFVGFRVALSKIPPTQK